ncbi:uncharacterized protein N0V89_012519 [Didymosphaeria variabile]|uniref:Uncharacterized protein n=1 Tax=Didymosphaeria variabile TaxID=1932322 RepID=A0A9W9C675_9PLEO|nr:uncharacterized protein N0V89_012519 [Didymosphaeria variabile]KAJ4344775.1 hypothetical protein N0V89_012519 [Didymosphaeria variabile]
MRTRILRRTYLSSHQLNILNQRKISAMENEYDNIEPDIVAAAEALATLATLGRGEQFVPRPRTTFIVAGRDREVIHSLFTPGRLRGTMHYEAKYETMAQDNLAKFLKAINQEPARAAVVRSITLDLVCDNPLNSGLVELFNEDHLPMYALTDDASDGPFPPLTEAALLLKAYQRDLVNDPLFANHPLAPTDFTLLDKNWLNCPRFASYLIEVHVNLFLRLCPKLQVIQLPDLWCPFPNLPFTEAAMRKWKEEHGWEVEIKEEAHEIFVRIGKKGGWTPDHIKRWLDHEISKDVARNG